MMIYVELLLMGAHYIQTLYKAICGDHLIEASTLPCEEGCCPHFTEVETEVQRGQMTEGHTTYKWQSQQGTQVVNS